MGKTFIRKRKTPHTNDKPEYVPGYGILFAKQKVEQAAAKGFSRPRFGPIGHSKVTTDLDYIAKSEAKLEKLLSNQERSWDKKKLHAANAGKRLKIKALRKEKKLKLQLA